MRNHAAGIAALDLFVVPSVSFKPFYGLVILRHARRLLVTISVTADPTAEWIAGQVTDAFPWDEAPLHLLRDRDHTFGLAYTRRVRAMRIRDHPVTARSPWQNGHVERLIGSIRRECLDHVIVFGEAHLRSVLKTYRNPRIEVHESVSLGRDSNREETERSPRDRMLAIGDTDVGASLGEVDRRGAADAAGAAGNQCSFAVEQQYPVNVEE